MFIFFFFNDTATTEIYTLSLHDALPILVWDRPPYISRAKARSEPLPPYRSNAPSQPANSSRTRRRPRGRRSEEHTSELQSRQYLVCRLLLEKKTNCTLTTCYI